MGPDGTVQVPVWDISVRVPEAKQASRPSGRFHADGDQGLYCNARVSSQRPFRPRGLTRENGSDRRKTPQNTSFRCISLLVLSVFLPQFSLEYRIRFLVGRLA